VQKLYSVQRKEDIQKAVAIAPIQDGGALPAWVLPLLGTFAAGCCCVLAAGSVAPLLFSKKSAHTEDAGPCLYQQVRGDEEEDITLYDEENVLYDGEETRLLAAQE